MAGSDRNRGVDPGGGVARSLDLAAEEALVTPPGGALERAWEEYLALSAEPPHGSADIFAAGWRAALEAAAKVADERGCSELACDSGEHDPLCAVAIAARIRALAGGGDGG